MTCDICEFLQFSVSPFELLPRTDVRFHVDKNGDKPEVVSSSFAEGMIDKGKPVVLDKTVLVGGRTERSHSTANEWFPRIKDAV